MGIRIRSLFVVLFAISAAIAAPQDADQRTTLDDQALLDAAALGDSNLVYGLPLDHYDADGYPESARGRLVLAHDSDGPMVYLKGDQVPYLLYAQYVNRQRDAVILARTGAVNDALPDGSSYDVPYGYGVVRFNNVYVSIIESRLIPHFSDNQKEYVQFPLTDLYLGGGFGLTGALATLRYVYAERYVGMVSVGYNPFRGLADDSFANRYIVPLHIGAGIRFPGFIQILGANTWTLGPDLMLGFGDRDGNPATPAGVLAPGVFLDVERVLFDESGMRRDYRSDPRPYNYGVNSLSVRVAAYLNVSGSGPLVIPVVGISYQVNVLGPRIPPHEFKETSVLYLNDVYREDLERQAQRRADRAARE